MLKHSIKLLIHYLKFKDVPAPCTTKFGSVASAFLVNHTSIQQRLLSQQGIWYDIVYYLAELRKAKPEDPLLIEHWEQLLAKVGLKAIATEPLLH